MSTERCSASLLRAIDRIEETALPLRAPAKVNLRLRVLGRFPNGYHDLSMINRSVSLADELVMTVSRGSGFSLSVEPPMQDTAVEDNLVAKAVVGFFQEFLGTPSEHACATSCTTSGVTPGICDCAPGREAVEPISLRNLPLHVSCFLTKKIPTGGGLGGGSSDAGAVLRGLLHLFGHTLCEEGGLPRSELVAKINKVALGCGADVPYAVSGGFAWVGGVGDLVVPLENRDPRPSRVVLLSPLFPSPTATFYRAYREAYPTIAPQTDACAAEVRARGVSDLVGVIGNDFEGVLCRIYPKLGDFLAVLRAFFPGRASITGSGATLFAIISEDDSSRLCELEREVHALGGSIGVYSWE